jgi:hypothetical protein
MSPQQPHFVPKKTEINFREILATTEESEYPSPASVALDQQEVARRRSAQCSSLATYYRAVRIGWSGWTNIIFATITSVGALFCTFHFFDSPDHFRRGSLSSREVLYPRPLTGSEKASSPAFAEASSRGANVIARNMPASESRPTPTANPRVADNWSSPSSPGGPNPVLPPSVDRSVADAARASNSQANHSMNASNRAAVKSAASKRAASKTRAAKPQRLSCAGAHFHRFLLQLGLLSPNSKQAKRIAHQPERAATASNYRQSKQNTQPKALESPNVAQARQNQGPNNFNKQTGVAGRSATFNPGGSLHTATGRLGGRH